MAGREKNAAPPAAGIEKKSGAVKGAALSTKARFWALIAILCAAVLLLNAVAVLLSYRVNTSADLTANAVFELDGATIDYISGLDKDVDIYVLAKEDDFLSDSYLIQAQRIMQQYPLYAGRIRLSYVDSVTDPAFASRFPQLALQAGNVLVVCGEQVKQMKLNDLFNFTLADSGNLVVTSSRAEEALTSAIMGVVSGEAVKVAVLTGNGAVQMPGLTQILTDNNYRLSEINLATMELPADCAFAVLLAPQTDLTVEELAKLDTFLYNGGTYGKTLFYTADVDQAALPNIETFIREWGIEIGEGVVFETEAGRTYQNQPYYPVADYVDAAYRDMLIDEQTRLLMPLSRPLKALFSARDNSAVTVLTQFAASAGVRPPDAPDTFRAGEAEVWGPMPALVLAQKKLVENGITAASSNVVVSASNVMLSQEHLYSTSLTNSEYILNIFSTISQRTDVLNVRPKSLGGSALTVTSSQAVGIGVTLFLVVPLVILAAGIAIWLRRRYG